MTINPVDPTELPLPPNPYLFTIEPPYSTGYEPQPNQVLVFPFTIADDQRIIFNLRQTALYVQDFTLGCWFSTAPYNPVLFYENRQLEISLLKGKNLQFAMQDINYTGSCQIPPKGMRTIFAEPGIYYFNVENRTGKVNKFEFVLQLVDLGP